MNKNMNMKSNKIKSNHYFFFLSYNFITQYITKTIKFSKIIFHLNKLIFEIFLIIYKYIFIVRMNSVRSNKNSLRER